MRELYNAIARLGARWGAEKIVLFGSRARGDHTERSDIDLAVYGMPPEGRAGFRLDLEELPTLLKFDVVHVDERTDQALKDNIEKDGVALCEKE